MKITCQRCKEIVDVAMYFYNHLITQEHYPISDTVEYKAVVVGKAICPYCGAELNEKFSSIISNNDLVRLAIGRELNK